MQYTYEVFKSWIEAHGPLAKEEMGLRSGLGFHKVGRILRQEKQPTRSEQLAIVSVLTNMDFLTSSGEVGKASA
jgi:hypothetical protein